MSATNSTLASRARELAAAAPRGSLERKAAVGLLGQLGQDINADSGAAQEGSQ